MRIQSLEAIRTFAMVSLLSFVGCGGSSVSSGPTISSVSISPTAVSLQVSQPEQFTAKVTGTGTFDSSVQWFVNGVAGGNSSVGTIVAGSYTAPAQVPNPSTVTIKAVATADSTKSAPAQATIRAILTPTVVWNETKLSLPGGSDGEVFISELPPGIALVDDGAGGAFVIWEHRFPVEILAQHLDPSGQAIWAPGGIPITNPWTGYQAQPRAISDGVGGFVVVWLDGRVGVCDPDQQWDCDIYGQRISATGALLWGATGKPIVTAANPQGLNGMAVVSDGAGGAVVAFTDARLSQGLTVYAQRVGTNGDPLWTTDGIRIGRDPLAADGEEIDRLKLISDGAGGAIGAWNYSASDTPISVRSQRISASGQLLWGSEPISVPGASDANATTAQNFDVTMDGSGGALFLGTWLNPNTAAASIHAQRIDATGTIVWSQSGVPVSNSSNDAVNPLSLADGSGGLFATWQDCPGPGSSDCDIVTQHLNASGQRTWGQSQIYISKMPNLQLAPSLQSDGAGGALITWADCRAYPDLYTCEMNSDIYAQHVDASGNGLWQMNGYALLADLGNQGEPYYTYEPPPYVTSIRLESGDILMAWPDGRDNTCFSVNPSTACELFIERIAF
jgi:hypothetical protein